jgi:excisionase family DNA binding protein
MGDIGKFDGRNTPAVPHEEELLDRKRLIRRWRHGSDAFFWRAEADGLLTPVRRGRATRYRWPDVFLFEGGLPADGFEQLYRADLLLPEEVAARIGRSRDWVLDMAKSGELPCRRVGMQQRFVPAEIVQWLKTWT